ncbi:endo-1,4-beta-xylanase [Microbacterium cremeum]|uniref:endo-1,4-beta-xylanase n=1 Tax=Microbacterium cremeum TaxID=2782169 RepID=UPI00188909CB|nr:endo-1,4-beta-xylanase [Microbacterium cremeum]
MKKRLRALGILVAAGLVAAGAVPAAAAPIDTVLDFDGQPLGAWAGADGWIQNGGGALEVVDLGGGDRALQVSGRANDWDGIQYTTTVTAGEVFDIEAVVRLAAGTAGSAGVRVVANNAGNYAWVGATSMTADAWTTVSGTYTAVADGSLQFYVGTDALDAPYAYLVDRIGISGGTAGGGPGIPPDFVPGGAVSPVATPVSAAQAGSPGAPVAALTFDDGPDLETTPPLLDFLAAKGLKAVFCVIGQQIQQTGGAGILRRIVAEGHVLCNHSTSFADMGSWTAEQVQADMIANLGIIRDALGDPNAKVPFWRAPNGSWGQTPQVAVSLGMQPLAVTNVIFDWETQDVATLTSNLRSAMVDGQLVLVHDGGGDRSGSLAAVETVVTERLAAGWEFTLPVGTPPFAGPVLTTDFESGLDGWEPRAGDATTPTVALTTDDAVSGAQAAIVTGRDGQGDGIGHDVTGVLTPGVTYDFSAQVRFPAGQPADAVWLSMARTVDGATSYSTLAQFTEVGNDGWTEVTASFLMGAADSAFLYLETNYNGANTSDLLVDDIVVSVPEPPIVQDLTPLKSTVDFPVGVAIDSRETAGAAADLLLRHFDQITGENHMKPEAWYDENRQFRPHPEAVALMDFAAANDLHVYGHVLVWHSQTPEWFFQDAAGAALTDSEADKQILRERLREHIFAIAQWMAEEYGEFGAGNPVVAWDVVNEVVSDSGEFADGLRRSEWYRILGEEFIRLAFQYADEAFNDEYAAEAASRPVTLFINDYNTEQGGKQDRYRALVERLLAAETPIDGVGHQFHVSLAMPVAALETAIERFEDLPLTQVVTELDVTTGTPVTDARLIEQGYYYRDAFRVFREHAGSLYSVTVWGLTDGRSWRSGNGAPLLFDDGYQAKPAYYGTVDHDLPQLRRTANVFAGDVPLDADAPASPQWRRLPLHAVGQDASFQLRWAPDHLTAYATVDDTTTDASDAVVFEIDGAEHRVPRSGAAGAVVAERDGGYDVVAHLPVTAALGGTLSADVRVTDGTDTAGWNSPGAVGTLTLVEELSFTEVVEASADPVIDGAVDDAWADAVPVTTGKQVSGTGGATATVRTMWRGNTLYVLAEVADPVIDVSGSDPWIQDSVEIYVDAGNAKNGAYRYDDTQIRISAENGVSFGTGDEAFQAARVQSASAVVDGGYVVEAAISLLEYGGAGTVHGLDFQVNDAAGGQRTSIRNWADPTGLGYQSTARWGVGELIGPAVAPGEPSQTTVRMPRTSLVSTQHAPVHVQVTSALPVAGGSVRVLVDGVAATGPVLLDADGRATVALGRLTPGTHEITAEFAGADGVAPSVSEPVTVTVRAVGPSAR